MGGEESLTLLLAGAGELGLFLGVAGVSAVLLDGAGELGLPRLAGAGELGLPLAAEVDTLALFAAAMSFLGVA